MVRLRRYRWSFKDEAKPAPAPVAHYPDVRAWQGRWRAACSCSWFGQPRDEWPDANTDGAAHVFAMKDR